MPVQALGWLPLGLVVREMKLLNFHALQYELYRMLYMYINVHGTELHGDMYMYMYDLLQVCVCVCVCVCESMCMLNVILSNQCLGLLNYSFQPSSAQTI